MEVKVFTRKELVELIYKSQNLPNMNYAFDLDRVDYFSYNDLSTSFSSEKYEKHLRFCVAYDSKHIYGVLKFSWFQSNQHYAISYVSTNKNYRNKGILGQILNCFCYYFKKTYKYEFLNISQYTLSGWKYLRPTILKYCSLFEINFQDNIIGFLDKGEKVTDEYYEMRKLSTQLVKREEYSY